MAVLALAAAGSALGSTLIGGTFFGMTGAQIGWVGGSLLGSAFFGPKTRVEGPRLGDLSVQASTYGVMRPKIYGTCRVSGNVIFCTDKREVKSETTEGGKGGPKVTTTTYSYNVDMAIALCQGEIAGIRKVWRNGELIFDSSKDADVGTVMGSSLHAEGFKLYTGTEDQLPDPTIEATVGVGQTPAYRGTAYVVFDHMDCPNGQIPQLSFEVATSADIDGDSIVYSTVDASAMRYACIGENTSWQFPAAGGSSEIRSVGPSYSEFERTASLTTSAGGTEFGPYPCQGGNKALMSGFTSGSYATPLNIVAFDLETGESELVLSYTPGTSDNSLRVFWCAYDPITGKYAAIAGTSGTRGECITILPANVMTPTLDTAFVPMAMYDNVVYCCGTRGGETRLQTYDGDDGTLIDEISAGEDLVSDILLVQVDAGGVYVLDGTAAAVATDRKVWKVEDGEWVLLTSTANFSNTNNTTRTFRANDRFAIVGPSNVSGGEVEYRVINFAGVDPTEVDLADIVEDICVSAGMDASDVDTTGITDTVHGYALTQVASARANLEPLMTAYFMDAVESDGVLKFRKRANQTVVASIAFDDLAAAEPGANASDPFPLTRTQEADLPRSVALSFINKDADYQPGAETARRQITESINDLTTDLPIATSASHVAAVAAGILYDAWQSRNKRTLKLTREFAYLDPGDNINVEYPAGTVTPKRIERITDTGLLLELEVVDSDPSLYDVTAPGVTPEGGQQGIAYPFPVKAAYLDIPILRDADDDTGFYVAARSVVENNFQGALIYRDNGTEFTAVTNVTTESVIGSTTTALPDWTGPDVMDEESSVTINVSFGELSSSTRDTVIDGQTNAILIGSEVVQFVTATEDSPGIYTLTRFLRGRRGTEWAMTGHVAGEEVVLLSTALRRIAVEATDIGIEKTYKAVPIGSSLDATLARTFTNEAVGKKPFSPVNLRKNEDTGDVLFTWDRRTRLASNILTDLLPLGEASEAYDVELVNGSGDVVYSDTVTEPQAAISSLAQEFLLTPAVQFVADADGDLVGTDDRNPAATSGVALRRYDATTGEYLGGSYLGLEATALVTVGSDVYVSVVNGTEDPKVYRIDKDTLIPGGLLSAAATYTSAMDADPQGLAYDGTNIWVSESYSAQIRKLDTSTLAVSNTYAINEGIGAMAYDSGYLYICDRGTNEIIKWDTSTHAEVLRIDCPRFPVDVLVQNGLVFVAGVEAVGVFNATTGAEVLTTTGRAYARSRRALVVSGDNVAFADPVGGQLVLLNGTTGAEVRRLDISGIIAVSGGTTDHLFAAVRAGGSAVETRAYGDNADLTGLTLKVYQLSETVGRGYPAEVAL